jgi:uncharacterized protein involved in response to NO
MAYRIFFPLAALEGIFVVGLWPLALIAGDAAPIDRSLLGEWHASELLYGYVSAVLAGFVLTALPRWTGKPLNPPPPISSLAALWIAGRVGAFLNLTIGVTWAAWAGSLFPVGLALLVARYVFAARNRRNEKVALLLALFALGVVVGAFDSGRGYAASLGERIGIAAALGLVMVFGGRIIPSLTNAVLAMRGKCPTATNPKLIEIFAAVLATAALASWVATPGALTTAILCAAAVPIQSLRLAQWHGLSVIRVSNVFFFHAAYACLPLGFALIALHGFRPVTIPAEASIHAWTIGAIGITSLAVMASMVRRQTGCPFDSTPAASAACALAGAAMVCRIAAAAWGSAADIILLAAALLWLAAFCLFLLFLRSRLSRAGRLADACPFDQA